MEGLCEAQSPKAQPPHTTAYPKARATPNEPKGGRVEPNDKTCAGQESCQSLSARMLVARCPAMMNNRPIRSHQRSELQTARLHNPASGSGLTDHRLHARGHRSGEPPAQFSRARKKQPASHLLTNYVGA